MTEFMAQFATVLVVSLVHFAWLAAVVGGLVWAVNRLFANRSAASRYQTGLAGMLGVLLAVPVSVWFAMPALEWDGPAAQPVATGAELSVAESGFSVGDRSSVISGDLALASEPVSQPVGPVSSNRIGDGVAIPSPSNGGLSVAWTGLVVAISPWVATVYLSGLVLMVVRLGLMLAGCHRILVRSELIADSRVTEILVRLAERIGLGFLPAVAMCNRVSVPVIVGIWKPVILFPASMLTGLTLAEVEIVLCHELAHLRRHDPIVVLFQRVLETVLFFHPAVWYISRSLDRERETCCDDIVLQAGTSKIAYATALCRVAELALSKRGGLSLAATGVSSAELMTRIRYILGQPPIQPGTTWNRSLVLAAVLAGIALSTTPFWISGSLAGLSAVIQQPSIANDPAQPKQDQVPIAFSILVVDQNDQPVPDAFAELTLWNHKGQVMWPRADIGASDGVVDFRSHGPLGNLADVIILVANDPGKSSASLMVFEGDEIDHLQEGGTLIIRLEPTMELKGTVRDIDTGEPVANARVRLMGKRHEKVPHLSEFTPPVVSDQNGNYVMPAVIPGLAGYLNATHKNYFTTTSFDPAISPSPGHNVFDLAIVPKSVSPNSKTPPVSAPDVRGLKPGEAIEKLKQEYVAANELFRSKTGITMTRAESDFLFSRLQPDRAWLDAMLGIADANPGTTHEVAALVWCCKMNMNTGDPDLAGRYKLRKAIGDRIVAKYLARPEIEECLDHLLYSQDDPVATARLIAENNPSHAVQGQMLMRLAEHRIRSWEKKRKVLDSGFQNDGEDPESDLNEAMDLLVRIKIDYADVPHWRDETLGNKAEMHLHSLTRLTVGKTAPEIVGLNQAGVEMKLSDFRGKIVVLDFWGSWCGPCIGELPEYEQVARLYPDDVVILGVMNDSREEALKAIEEHKVSWSNWIDTGDKGPITTDWNITAWPTTFILDRHGIIRQLSFAKTAGAENLRVYVEKVLVGDKQQAEYLEESRPLQETENDKFAFDTKDYEYDFEKGFSVVFKLLMQAERENAPAATVARLRYQAANMLRLIELNKDEVDERDFSRAITILRGVLTKPDKFLVSKASAQWFANCVGLLSAIYVKKGNSTVEIDEAFRSAIADVRSAKALSDRDRFLLSNGIRLSASDIALDAEDWRQAVQWVQPLIDSADEYLKDKEGAGSLAMAVRQQSMFLANNGDAEESAAMIDETCEKLEKAGSLDEATRIRLQCMLRGKHLINFDRETNEAQIDAGWPKYQALAKRSRAYQGPERAGVLRACIRDMDRLAVSSWRSEDIGQAIDLIHETMAIIEAEPELQDPEFQVLWSLQDMARLTCQKLKSLGDPREKIVRYEVAAFVARYQKNEN